MAVLGDEVIKEGRQTVIEMDEVHHDGAGWCPSSLSVTSAPARPENHALMNVMPTFNDNHRNTACRHSSSTRTTPIVYYPFDTLDDDERLPTYVSALKYTLARALRPRLSLHISTTATQSGCYLPNRTVSLGRQQRLTKTRDNREEDEPAGSSKGLESARTVCSFLKPHFNGILFFYS
ncbi:hypothetical protein CPC08DRAFT_728164 [Agrocybe pediades]|nr:hypothetical protein CPC08DRAFT_728164 [Agrocybe pediades]